MITTLSRGTWLLFALGLFAYACAPLASSDGSKPVGALSVNLDAVALGHGVTAVRFDVHDAASACDASALATHVVDLLSGSPPASVSGEAAAQHAFSDSLFVLAPGDYRVCATPLAGDEPSASCARAEALSSVVADKTTEIVLVSQCKGNANGATDLVVELNDPPTITALTLDPSKFISVCESVAITVSAEDPNGDELGVAWSIAAGPDGAHVRAADSTAIFSGPAGDYTLEVDVSDSHAARASLAFPIHVSSATCSVPDDVQQIFANRCAPCHITGTSGGLSLVSADVSYANLVAHPASAAACADRRRVVPGDHAGSYLVHKLRAAADICGAPMPRGRPALPEEEIAAIEAWIDSLPH